MHIYLYVKQHQSTGLLYFGKTTRRDPFKYKGSGTRWTKHLKKHGVDINTIELWGFDNQEDCTRFALEFSEKHHIVESNEWANLMPENGMGGGVKHSEETKAKMRKPKSEETKAKLRAANLGRNLGKKRSEETKAKIRASKLGTQFSEEHKAKMRKPRSEETKAKMRKPKSEEHKAKMRTSQLGKKHTDETKAKIRAARLGKSRSEEAKAKMYANLCQHRY
jgi:hypothetical protein